MARNLLGVVLFLLYQDALLDKPSNCANNNLDHPAGSTNCATSGAHHKLRWRALPYAPSGEWVTHGGINLETAIQGLFEGPVLGDDWDLLWTYRLQRKVLKSMELPNEPPRLINHCGYFRGAGQKCILARHIARVLAARQSESIFGNRSLGFLYTYQLHDDVSPWIHHVAQDPDRYWIVKACSGGGSAQIELVRGHDVLASETKWLGQWLVAQEYLMRPFLGYGGRKFHLRVYILVTSWWPSISVLLYDEGMLFRSRHKYVQNKPTVERDVFSYIDDAVEGQPLQTLWDALDSQAEAPLDMEGEISVSILVRKRIAAMFQVVFANTVYESFGDASELMATGFKCFDLFGADVMIDEDLTPALLEINMSPNLETDDVGIEYQRVLKHVKEPLLKQVLHWAALRVRLHTANATESKMIEDLALLNFTRIL